MIRQNRPELILFFTGWGMDERPFLQAHCAGRDLLLCYDYSDLTFDEELLKGYTGILVVAWSLGVWVAQRTLSRLSAPVIGSIAVNGTLYPVSDDKGIPAAVFWGTLHGLNDLNMQKFRRRMCESPEVYKEFLEVAPTRSLESLKHELEQIGTQYIRSVEQDLLFHWNVALIGSYDRIFAPESQNKAWQEGFCDAVYLCEAGHYMPGLVDYAIHQIRGDV